MNKHGASAFLPLVQALAAGKIIQHFKKPGSGFVVGWRDISEPGFSGPPEHYRIKPEVVTTFRLALMKRRAATITPEKGTHYPHVVCNPEAEVDVEKLPNFDRWLTERATVIA